MLYIHPDDVRNRVIPTAQWRVNFRLTINGYIKHHSRASERVCGSLEVFLFDDLEKRSPTLTDAQSDKHQNQVAISGPCIDNRGTKFSIYAM
jgi:hypothetical protein